MVTNSLRDPETGLYNDPFFTASVPSRLSSAKRALRPLSIVLLAVGGPLPGEVDGGAATGREVAYGLLRTLRESALACRLDNGRFGLLLDVWFALCCCSALVLLLRPFWQGPNAAVPPS